MTSPWPHDDTTSLIAFYGDPSQHGWADRNLVTVAVPWRMVYADSGHVVPGFFFHTRCAAALGRVLTAIWLHYGKDQAAIEAVGMQRWDGAYAPRNIRGSSRLSCHAFGAAVDFDAAHEAMNTQHISHMAQPVIDAFKAEGAFWGGDFIQRQDPMHFQFAHE